MADKPDCCACHLGVSVGSRSRFACSVNEFNALSCGESSRANANPKKLLVEGKRLQRKGVDFGGYFGVAGSLGVEDLRCGPAPERRHLQEEHSILSNSQRACLIDESPPSELPS